jgi:hypothetical protein
VCYHRVRAIATRAGGQEVLEIEMV